MKKPMPPPDIKKLWAAATGDGRNASILPRLFALFADNSVLQQKYLSWDELRYKTPPAGLNHEQWWLATKMARTGALRRLSLTDVSGRPFTYTLSDEVLKETDFIASSAKGNIRLAEQVTDSSTRDRYLVSQLIEEAITSSQLEGASTSRKVARDMIRSGRQPRTKSERMILNNFLAMQRIGEVRAEPLSIDLICEIHRIVTDGTLDDPSAAGRFQRPDEERVAVRDEDDEVLHRPPPADQLPERMARLCDFANGHGESGYLPGVLRAIAIHFMFGYEHPFEDGNGRTARALFYWSMLNQGYWLTEFLSVSRILKKAPAQYARSFLYTEQDDNDLTYFFIYHLNILHRALDELNAYLASKMKEIREVRRTLNRHADFFNSRQLALLQHALRNADFVYTVESHRSSHRIATQTARTDLMGLELMGLLTKQKAGKRFAYTPVPDLAERIRSLGSGFSQPCSG